MMFVEVGGQQLVGFAPAGRSGAPHVLRSGGDIGAAKAKGLLLRVAAPQSPPRPMRTFLLGPTMFGSSLLVFGVGLFWLPLHANLGTCWRFSFLFSEAWHCFRDNGYKEVEVLEETLMVDTKEKGEIDAMFSYLIFCHKDF